jgi:hypothetical protein
MKNAVFWDVTPCGSEGRIGSIITVTSIGEIGKAPAVTSNRNTLRRNMMEAIGFPETSVLTRATDWPNKQRDSDDVLVALG